MTTKHLEITRIIILRHKVNMSSYGDMTPDAAKKYEEEANDATIVEEVTFAAERGLDVLTRVEIVDGDKNG